MASIFKPKGRKVYYLKVNFNGVNDRISLDKLKASSEHLSRNIEKLISFKKHSMEFTPELVAFIKTLSETHVNKLVKIGIIKPQEKQLDLMELRDQYIEDLVSYGRSKLYVSENRTVITAFLSHSGALYPSEIKRESVKRFLAIIIKRGKSNRTYNKHLQIIGGFVRSLKKSNQLMLELDIPKRNESIDKRRPRRALTVEEIDRLLISLHGKHHGVNANERRMIYLFGIDLGFRWSEICTLRVGDINIISRTVTIQAKNEKARRGATLPLSTGLHKLLVKYLTQPIRTPDSILFEGMWLNKGAATLKEDLNAADIDYITYDGYADFHSLRHTCGTRNANAGVLPHENQKIMRHGSSTTTAKYYTHVTTENLENAMKKSEAFQNQEKVRCTADSTVTKNVTNN